jgi:magnesium transporter
VIAIVTHAPDEGLKEGQPREALATLLQRKERVVWVDLSAPTREEAAILSSVFSFHPLALEDCEARRHHPKIDDFRDYLFILTHGVHPESSMREFKTRQLSLFVGPNYVVSFHKEKSRSVEHALEAARKNPRVMADGPASILYNILDFQVDQYFPVLDNFERKIDEIEDRVFTGATSSILEEVLALKRALMRLRRISGHQREILSRLIRREFPLIDEKNALYLRDVYDHLVRITDLADTYRELVSGVLEAHLSIVSNRTNEIMRALTVIATLFIPLTFIVGLYGMNFDFMPELHWKYGYLFVWGVMIAVAAGMYLFFRRRGINPRPEL